MKTGEIKMNFKYYQSLVDDASEQTNKELWIAECGYPFDCPYSANNWIEILSIIYDVAHCDIKELVKRVGKMTAFSDTYRIPYKTLQNWCGKTREPQTYLIRLIGYTLVQNIEGNQEVKNEKI